ncbi:MAG: hypothetical protein AABX34_07215 [Nanoarchaeota archaeon]
MPGLRLGPEIKLDTGYKFTRAVDCNILELESVLDYFAPTNERKGNWIHNPQPQDLEETYRACYETLRGIVPNTELTTAQYIRKALADKEEGSSEIFQLIKTLAEYLPKNESKRE